jgi:hypothetical protein
VASYEGFWSDTAESFHPVTFGTLHAGDRVSVSMSRSRTGWELILRDPVRAVSESEDVAYDPHATYTQAEWLQEDPAPSSVTAKDLPYPTMGVAVFTSVQVNGATPTLVADNAVTLSATGGVYLVPTRFLHTSFTFRRATGAARRYLADAFAVDTVQAQFDVELRTWSTLSAPTRRGDVHDLSVAEVAMVRTLLSQPWSPATQRPVRELASTQLRLARAFAAWARSGASLEGPAYDQLSLVSLVRHQSVITLRSTLGLPPP